MLSRQKIVRIVKIVKPFTKERISQTFQKGNNPMTSKNDCAIEQFQSKNSKRYKVNTNHLNASKALEKEEEEENDHKEYGSNLNKKKGGSSQMQRG